MKSNYKLPLEKYVIEKAKPIISTHILYYIYGGLIIHTNCLDLPNYDKNARNQHQQRLIPKTPASAPLR